MRALAPEVREAVEVTASLLYFVIAKLSDWVICIPRC